MANMIVFITIIAVSLGQQTVRFVATGDDSAGLNNNLWYSPDGFKWTPINNIFTLQGNNAAYSLQQRLWIATGSGINTIAYSPDGITWIGLGTTVFSTEGRGSFYSSKQNLWVAMGSGTNTIATSTDGKVWTGRGSTIFTTRGQDVAYSPNLDKWVAVGEGTNTIATSTNGITWTGLGLIIFTVPVSTKPLGVTFSSQLNQFVVVGLGNIDTQAYSPDGTTWTGTGSLFSNTVQDVAYGQNKWILTGAPTPNPTPFATSTNGISWTISANMVNQLNGGRGITYSQDLDMWITIGFGTVTDIISSDNGIAWANTGSKRFSITGYGVASGGYTAPLPPKITNLITNSSIVNIGNLTSLSGNLTVQGDLNIAGQMILNSSQAVINVNTSIVTSGILTVIPGSTLNSDRLKLTPTSQLEVLISQNYTIGVTTTVTIANYNTLAGTYSSVTLRSTTNQCLNSQTSYGSSTLSVLITPYDCSSQTTPSNVVSIPSGNQTNSDSARLAIIIGSTVGAVVIVAVAVTILIVMLMKRQIKLRDKMNSEQLKIENIASLQRYGSNL